MPELPGLTPTDMALLLLIYFVAGTVKGGLGFGLPLVAISLSSLFLPVDLILAINAVVLFPTNLYQFATAGPMLPTIRRFWPVVAGLSVATPLAALFIADIDPRLLVTILGIMVMLFTILTIAGPKVTIPQNRERGWGLATGLVSGVVGALTTSPGPVFVMYVVGLKLPRQVIVSALGMFMMVVGLTLSIAYWQTGLIDSGRLITGIICLPIAAIGMFLGNRIAGRASAKLFSNVILAMLFLLGANMFIRSILN